MSKDENYKKAIEYLNTLNIEMVYRHAPENPHMADSRKKFNFLIDFNLRGKKEKFTLYFSQSHREPIAWGRRLSMKDHSKGVASLKLKNKHPDIFGLLNCIVSDADCLEYCFEEWCENLGYDPDSRNAEKIYFDCCTQTRGAQKIFDFEAIREYLEENELN